MHLSRAGFIPTGVKDGLARFAQPSDEIRERLRPVYTEDADSLIAGSQVICTIERCGPRGRYLTGAPTRSRTQPDSDRWSARTGAKSASHRHAGIVIAYVLEGTIRSQLNGSDVIEYSAGQNWVEPPGTVHTHTENPSQTVPARRLAVCIAPTGAHLTSVDK